MIDRASPALGWQSAAGIGRRRGEMDAASVVPSQVIGILVAFGASLLLMGLPVWLFRWAVRARRWPRAPGTVLESGSSIDEGTTVEVSYEYLVDGRRLTGKRVRFGGPTIYYRRRSAVRALARYPAGAEVSVAFDPRKPERATLETDFDWWGWTPAILLGLTIAISWTLHLCGYY
jgi:hypothetical protein